MGVELRGKVWGRETNLRVKLWVWKRASLKRIQSETKGNKKLYKLKAKWRRISFPRWKRNGQREEDM